MKVLLVGNYERDAQESMLRFNRMLQSGLAERGVGCESVAPAAIFARQAGQTYSGKAKILGYLDKYLCFPGQLLRECRRIAAAGPLMVHICDHSNAVYAPRLRKAGFKVVVTCHDLIAVRAGVENSGEYHFSASGRYLQRRILRGLGYANGIASVSGATQKDVARLVKDQGWGLPRQEVIWNGLNHPFARLPETESKSRLEQAGWGDLLDRPFLFHLGTSQPRKNRDTILKVVAEAAKRGWAGRVIFAGDSLWPELLDLVDELKIKDRVVQVGLVSNEVVEAFYNRSFAFLFPSRSEGFGWPVIEAQACGCPVLSSNAGPLPEILGPSASLRDPDDVNGFADDLLRLAESEERLKWRELGLANAAKFTAQRMIEDYIHFYRKVQSE